MTGAGKYQRLSLASIVRRAAEEALERRFSARHQPRPRWGGAKVRRKKKSAPPPPAPRRPRACGICGELGHRADSAWHKAARAEPVVAVVESAGPTLPPAPPVEAEIAPRIPAPGEVIAPPATPAGRARAVRACSICGELGHRADNLRHRAAAEPSPEVAPAPASPSPPTAEVVVEAAPPRAAARPPKRTAQAQPARRSFLPVLPAPSVAPPAPIVRADELEEVLAEAGGDADEGDEELAPPPSMRTPRGEAAGAPGEEAAAELEPPAPAAAPERLRWTPGPGGEDDHVPALEATLARRSKYNPHSIAAKRIVGERNITALTVLSDAEAEAILPRPRTRGDCANVPRPCPFVSCAHHLFLDVNEDTGTIKLNYPTKEPWELAETCALDVAEAAGGATLEAVGELCGITRERVRQVEERALAKLRRGVPEARDADSPGPALRHPHGEVAA